MQNQSVKVLKVIQKNNIGIQKSLKLHKTQEKFYKQLVIALNLIMKGARYIFIVTQIHTQKVT